MVGVLSVQRRRERGGCKEKVSDEGMLRMVMRWVGREGVRAHSEGW